MKKELKFDDLMEHMWNCPCDLPNCAKALRKKYKVKTLKELKTKMKNQSKDDEEMEME